MSTYTSLKIHLVFAVQNRAPLIKPEIRSAIEKYISGIIQNQNHKILAIYCMPDHCHILIGLNPNQSISDLMRDVKSSSSKWIKHEGLIKSRFNWQEGYGAFSHSSSEYKKVIDYINNQENRHSRCSSKKEIREMLENSNAEFKEQYL